MVGYETGQGHPRGSGLAAGRHRRGRWVPVRGRGGQRHRHPHARGPRGQLDELRVDAPAWSIRRRRRASLGGATPRHPGGVREWTERWAAAAVVVPGLEPGVIRWRGHPRATRWHVRGPRTGRRHAPARARADAIGSPEAVTGRGAGRSTPGQGRAWSVGGQSVNLTNLDKVLFPAPASPSGTWCATTRRSRPGSCPTCATAP